MRIKTKECKFKIKIQDAIITVCPLTTTQISKLKQNFTKIIRGREELDDSGFGLAVFCKTVRDWEGIYDEDGNPLPCTEETKKIVWDHNPDLANEILERTDRELKAMREAEEGNLESGASGSSLKAA